MLEVKTIVKIIGSKEETQRLRNLVDTNQFGFDFNNVIPEPKELEPTLNDDDLGLDVEIHRISLYGVTTSKEWRQTYWGTISPNISTSWYRNSYFKMITADTPPTGIFKALSLHFDVELYVFYTSGEECGVMIVKKGEYLNIFGNEDEASLLSGMVEDSNYSYDKWVKENPKATKGKKLDMELLFNLRSEFVKTSTAIIDPKWKKITRIKKSTI